VIKVLRKIIGIVLVIEVIFCFSGCTQSKNYIVRFDIDKSELDSLYKGMPEKEIYEILGLPHRSTQYIDSTTYDYFIGDDLLRMELKYKKLYEADFFENDAVSPIWLQENKPDGVDGDKYLRTICYKISSDNCGFMGSDTNFEEVQSTLGPPHYISEYDLDGVILNAFVYKLSDGNRLYIIYKRNGLVGIAQIQNMKGEIVKDIVKVE
jgi:outer membrane protein assembly factor BamE (lipoprotein component of BamABCDE complex)